MSKIPLKYNPRKEQEQMFEFAKKSMVEDNKTHILINASVGSGKSFAAIMISKWYREHYGNDKKINILTGTKILQNQYVDDFPFIRNLKGKSNYWCDTHKTDCKTGKELNVLLKQNCTNCPYDRAKAAWLASDISLTNFHLFDTYSIFFTDVIKSRGANLLIVDEAHDFEGIFNSFLSIGLNNNTLRKCGLDQRYQENCNILFSRIKTIDHVITFLQNKFINDITDLKDEYLELIADSNDNHTRKMYMSYINTIDDQLSKFQGFLYYYNEDKTNWTIDISENRKTKLIDISIQPIWSHNYLKRLVWDQYDHVIFLSGTILDKKMFSYVNGLDVEKTAYIEIDSTFPIENRPVYYVNGIGRMTYKDKRDTFEKQIPLINKILKKYSKDKGIIHTGNYEISEWVKDRIRNKRLIFHDTGNREEKYNKFISSTERGVIVSPSMGTGISLDDNLARFGIILKIPYPNISNSQIKARMESDPAWYRWYTATQIIQSLGRIVRSEDDYGHNYILDGSFSTILSDGYVPHYIIDAVRILK